MKPLFILVILFFLYGLAEYVHRTLNPSKKISIALREDKARLKEENAFLSRLQNKATVAKQFAAQKKFSDRYAFFIDMRLPSGKKRFFVYDLQKDTIRFAGLVAHGSCNNRFLETPQFSNTPECGCSAAGKYKIGNAYEGRFGKAFKLHGLDSTNFNAYGRYIVLHAYSCVPDEEVHPQPICNSLGCPMVSYLFLTTLTALIENTQKPILLWIY